MHVNNSLHAMSRCHWQQRLCRLAGVHSLGSRINAARLAAGISAAELARRAKISRMYVGQLERDQREPTVGIIAKIARALGVDPCALAFGADSDRPLDRS